MSGLWFFQGVFGLALYIGVFIIIGLVVRHFMQLNNTSTHPGAATDSTAIDILKERFAKGEIDKAEYEERKEVLMK